MTKAAILVTGASGKVGSAVVRELCRRGEPVRAAVRDPRRLQTMTGVEVVRFDFEDETTSRPALEGVDRVFLLPPPGNPRAVELATRLLELAAPRLRQVVTLSFAGAEQDPESPLRQIELWLEGSGIPWTHLRPNWFAQNFHTIWLSGVRAGTLVLPADDGRCAFIDVRDVAEAAAVALTSSGHTGKGYYLSGPEALSFFDATAILSRETGRDIHYQPLPEAEFRSALVQAGVPEQAIGPLLQLFVWVRAGAAAAISPDAGVILGRAPRTLAEYARDHRALLAGEAMAPALV